MARDGGSDVVKKVMRFKLQLADKAQSATVLKTLQKLKDLDITLEILAETGIGKTVNSLRRHEEAGEFAKSLVRGWKKLVPKTSTSLTEDGDMSDSMCVKDKLDDQNCPNGGLTMEDLNNNCVTSHGKNQETSNEPLFKTRNRKADVVKRCEEHKRRKEQNESNQENQNILKSGEILSKNIVMKDDDDKRGDSRAKKTDDDCDSVLGNKNTGEPHQKSRPDYKEKLESSSDCGGFGSEKESNKKSAQSKESLKDVAYKSRDKCSKKLFKLADVKDDRSSGLSRSSGSQKRKKKDTEKRVDPKWKESECKRRSKPQNKKAKTKHKDKKSDVEVPSMSFESYLNYDENVSKKRERSGAKKPHEKIKTAVKDDPGTKPATSVNVLSPKKKLKKSVMDLINIPLPAFLPECENPTTVDYFERKVEKESDLCDVSEESAVFTGQRLNKKMQVYSGAKTIFLPAMMSLYQQCIRTLQNNINLLHETGGVPFEILEPVLERCTPEQLLHVEECNPIYIGETDHLWGKHCQRDFKHSKLQEYESWKEMYIRLSEERERKLQRLTKSIVSAHSNKPKGRQVKMAFIHTVAKPPRDVRIQQEIHGTAVQQPHPPRCSVKVQENRSRSSTEPARSSSTSSGTSNTQDPRKKTRVAPMMAKSLRAFKNQLGRR